MSIDLLLKPSCSGCGSSKDLYGSNCKHLTLCLSCGKTMAENHAKCYECGTSITRLIREYNVRACSSSDKNYFIGRFVTGLPSFSRKQSAENKWSLQKEGLQGRQLTDSLREKYKNKPWLLEDETGQSQYHGQLEGAQSATYYLLMMQGKEFVAIPAGITLIKLHNISNLPWRKQKRKMKNRRKTADGYQRWMMKAANNGPAAFGEVEKFDDKESGAGGGRGRRKTGGEDEDANVSDRGEEDEEDEAARKNRLGLNKRSGDDDEEGPRGGDLDLDDDDIEKGDDWEHEEIFTDDDEAVGNDPEEREDLAPEIPAPPEIKQSANPLSPDTVNLNKRVWTPMQDVLNSLHWGTPYTQECLIEVRMKRMRTKTNEEEGGLSKSGKELKKLLGRSGGLNDSDAEDDDDDDDTEDDGFSPVLAPKPKDAPKEEPVDNSPLKATASGSARGTPTTSKSTKGKRKTNGDDAKTSNGGPAKKVKTENEVKPSKDETVPASKVSVPTKGAPPSSSKAASTPPTGPVTEDEIRAVLMQKTPVTTQDLVGKFKSRLKSKEDKDAFAAILRRISKIQKTNGPNYVVLRDK
ncbi:transcription initiation factor IIF subunit alpha RAP74 [Actinidia rufa]|uniref:Transcription initiation factor IIF subunit alpha n=1 Tax=Actinidia rufa TaxID=165716 RepID=A0A7J0FTS9_9ERIC|nr:transcription initiation factor IIF subunit alpha RAP74 [Actinidia rufa]